MGLKPAGVPAGRSCGQLIPEKRSTTKDTFPRPASTAETAEQIERAYPGYRVWVSDAGWWYATRTHPWACGQAATVHGPGPGELFGALAGEQTATLGRAMSGAW
jgi:hypothetical protein